MLDYTNLVVAFYKKELQEDVELWHGLIQEWILIPRDTTMQTYMAMHGILGCAIRVLVLLFVRVPVWWPMHLVAYVINCTVRYTFVPLLAFLQWQLNKALINNNHTYITVFTYLIIAAQWVEWILKTVFLITYVVDKIVIWLHTRRSLRGYIDYKVDQIVVKAHTIRNEKQKQSRLRKLYIAIKQGWVTYITPVPRLILQGVKFIFKYINPLNYKWVKYLVYYKNRQHLIVILKCRVIIRYALIKGLIKYGIQGWLWLRLCRWARVTNHLRKVIFIKYYPKLAILNMWYWLAFHIWWITVLMYKYVCYCYIYFVGGMKWLALCGAVITSPILYTVLHLLYIINALNIWFTHGLWVSRSSFCLMLGFSPNISFWKSHTRIK